MKHRVLLATCAGFLAVGGAVAMFVTQGQASGATQASTHNGNLNPVCGSQIAPVTGSEFNGVTENGAGSYLGAIELPQGATITSLGFTAHDFTDPADASVFLIRKGALAQTSFTGKYSVVASVSSSGAVDQARHFSSSTIKNPVVDNFHFAYFVELVNCDDTIQPTAVQVDYTTP
jgi:hypothetical protein